MSPNSMIPNFAARRETLMLERETISRKIRAQCRDHEKIMDHLQGDLRVIDARLEEIETFFAELGPDLSGHVPIAGGPIEPNRRRPRLDYRALTLEQIRHRPGQTPAEITGKIAQLTVDLADRKPRAVHKDRVLGALAYWEARGQVEKRNGEEWWPIEIPSEGPQRRELEVEAQTPPATEAFTSAPSEEPRKEKA